MRPALAAAAAAVLSAGCSWTFVRGPPTNHEQPVRFDCTASALAPALDLLGAASGIAIALNAAATRDRTWTGSEDRGSTMAIAFGWFALSSFSAWYGFTETSRCEAAREEQVARLAGTDLQLHRARATPGVSVAECDPLLPALARAGAQVHSGPDPVTRLVATLAEETGLCAGSETKGFGFRRIRLPDATTGFVAESSLAFPPW